MHSEGELLSKAQDYFDQNSTFGKSESNSARTINYGDYFPVWKKSKLVQRSKTFLVVPFYKWVNRAYGDQNYIRRLVFEYGTDGELIRAGLIELISGTLSLRQLAERHETIIDQYLKGNPSDGVGIVWSDVNMNELEGIDLEGRRVTIQEQSEGIGSRILDDGCVYYFYVLTDKTTNTIIYATFLYKECPPPNFSDVTPCEGDGFRVALDPEEGDFLPCVDPDAGIGGADPTLDDCESLQLMGFDVECVYDEDKIDKDPSFEGTIADCIFEKLKSIDGFKDLASGFEGLGTEFDVVLKIGPTQSASANGQAKFKGINQPIEITFNEARMNRSALEVARTIVHEMVHAEIYRAIKNNNPDSSDSTFRDNFNKYVMMYRGPSDQQHNLMADEWVTKMGGILKSVHQMLDPEGYDLFTTTYYSNGIPDKFYESVAWDGLQGTIAYNLMQLVEANPPTLPVAPIDRINQDIENVRQGRKGCL